MPRVQRYTPVVEKLVARVRGGRLVLDEPVDLPEGTEVHLAVSDDWDDLDDAERAALTAAIASAWARYRRGESGRSAEALIADLRARR